jgi:ergothioneine biosynthesis protein EgtB
MSPSFVSPWAVYQALRQRTLKLTEALSAEDQAVQSMPNASPAKWHLAHTTWFFEAVVLTAHAKGYQVFDLAFHYLFNSYYESLGERQPRDQRGLLTRPSLTQIHAYRAHVDAAMEKWLNTDGPSADAVSLFELGLHHEQQHQELLVTDMLHALSRNPLLPDWGLKLIPQTASESLTTSANTDAAISTGWRHFAGGVVAVGHGGEGFAFDNETPRHQVLLRPYALADRLVSCGEYLAFMLAGAYERPEYWLSEGWSRVKSEGWTQPIYWHAADDGDEKDWQVFGLQGLQKLDPEAPVTHLSFFEAAAFAAWAGARLPTEFEWENAAALAPDLPQLFGAAWQWTRSSYDPYPGFAPLSGAVAEYNGKFMVGQLVLRGSSAYTPTEPMPHARISYRNFFSADSRWQCTGLRLAKDSMQ